MKHLTLLGAAVWMSLLAGCQQNELTGKMDESLDVRLQASVAGTDASSRTLLEENGKTVFAEGDEIGLFNASGGHFGEMEPFNQSLDI